jgi:hypothetical protein
MLQNGVIILNYFTALAAFTDKKSKSEVKRLEDYLDSICSLLKPFVVVPGMMVSRELSVCWSCLSRQLGYCV